MFAATATFALLASAVAVAPLKRGNGDVIPGQYMVMFHKTSTLADRDAHMAKINVCCSHACVLLVAPQCARKVSLACLPSSRKGREKHRRD